MGIPSMNKIKGNCQKILPLTYNNSLSYYEVLCKVTKVLNDLVENNNSLPEYIVDEINRILEGTTPSGGFATQEDLNNLTQSVGALADAINNTNANVNSIVTGGTEVGRAVNANSAENTLNAVNAESAQSAIDSNKLGGIYAFNYALGRDYIYGNPDSASSSVVGYSIVSDSLKPIKRYGMSGGRLTDDIGVNIVDYTDCAFTDAPFEGFASATVLNFGFYYVPEGAESVIWGSSGMQIIYWYDEELDTMRCAIRGVFDGPGGITGDAWNEFSFK